MIESNLIVKWELAEWKDIYWFALRRNSQYQTDYSSFMGQCLFILNKKYKFKKKYREAGDQIYESLLLSKKPSRTELEDKIFYDTILNSFIAKWLIPPTDFKTHYPAPEILPPPITFNDEYFSIGDKQILTLNLANEVFLPSYDLSKFLSQGMRIGHLSFFKKHIQIPENENRSRQALDKNNIVLAFKVKEFIESLPINNSKKPRGKQRTDNKILKQIDWPRNTLSIYKNMVDSVKSNKSATQTNLLKNLDKSEELITKPYLIIYCISNLKELPESFYELRVRSI